MSARRSERRTFGSVSWIHHVKIGLSGAEKCNTRQSELRGDLTNVAHAASSLRDELQARNRLLRQERWLAGEKLSAADLNLYPFLASLERALLQPAAAQLDLERTPITDRFPGIGRWMNAIRALPGYERTKPMHWN